MRNATPQVNESQITLGAGKGYDAAEFIAVATLRVPRTPVAVPMSMRRKAGPKSVV